MTARPSPLDGLRVLDLGRVYQGPWCGFLLAMAGADVVKVEEPSGEPSRRGAGPDGTTVPFAIMNSNKRNVTLNLKHPDGRKLLLDLVRRADVLLENFTPGTMDDLGVGPDVLLEANPRLVYGAATGFGVDGPDRDRLAMDITIQAAGGVMSVTGFEGQPPVKAGVAFVDFLGATNLYAGIMTALFERERTGRGGVVDVAMIDTIYPTLASNLSGWYRDGVAGRSANSHGGGALAPYNVYATADGHVAIIVITEQQWRNLTAAMGRPDLADDDRFRSNGRRYHNMDVLDGIVGAWTSARTRDEVVVLCDKHRVPAAAVRDVGEVVNDRHLHARGALQHVDHPQLGDVVLPNSPMRFRGTPLVPLVPSGGLGEHNAEVYAEWLSLASEDVDRLRRDGVI